MDGGAIGAIGGIVGAAAVVVSLVFVGTQVRQNTQATERSNARQTSSDHERSLENFLDEKIADIILRGLEELTGLTPLERYRFDLATSIWLETVKQAYADSKLGSFPDDILVAYRNRLFIMLDTPGGVAWWEQRQAWFSPSSREEVNRLSNLGAPKEMENAGIGAPPRQSAGTDA
ncbi:MAG: hypothetical protein ACI8XZ_002416 [Gammaproteobacteria bacterium]|jgi:hypothetical protein